MSGWIFATLARIRSLFLKSQLDQEVNDELAAHIEMLTDDNMRRGMNREAARREALVRIGSLDTARELHRDARGLPWVESLGQDVGYALRGLRQSPGFAVLAVISLALGIGATTAIFSVIDPLFLTPLPVEKANEVVSFRMTGRDLRVITPVIFAGKSGGAYPAPVPVLIEGIFLFEYQRLEESKAFTGLGTWSQAREVQLGNAKGDFGQDSTVQVEQVTANLFSTLGLQPALGRAFDKADEAAGARPVSLISHAFWLRQFGGDPKAIGKSIAFRPTAGLAPITATIVGVLPRGFDSLDPGVKTDFWVPVPLGTPVAVCCVAGRLRPGITLRMAQLELDAINAHIRAEWSGMLKSASALSPQLQELVGLQTIVLESGGRLRNDLWIRFGARLRTLMVMVLFLLLSACINIAALLVARGVSRQKELTIRVAVGGGRARLIRQLMTESIVLASIGGVAGILVSFWGIRLLLSSAAMQTPSKLSVAPDSQVLLFALCLTMLSALLFGMLPAVKITKPAITSSLNVRHRWSTQKLLISVQLASSMVLIVGAGLLLRTLFNMKTFDPGFDKNSVVKVELRNTRDPAQLVARFRGLPGVLASTTWFGGGVLLGGQERRVGPIFGDGSDQTSGECYFSEVDSEYFRTLGILILEGRNLLPDDDRHVAVISASMARFLFGNQDPVGRHYYVNSKLDEKNRTEVVGVVADVKYHDLREQPPLACYKMIASENNVRARSFALRTNGPPAGLLALTSSVVGEMEPGAFSIAVETIADRTDRTMSEERLLGRFATLASLIAVFLTCVGVAGSMAYSVSQRTLEFGIRTALGAQVRDIIKMLMRETSRIVVAGCALGLVTALFAVRLITRILFGVSPSDPMTLLSATFLLIGVTAVSAYIPARRASRADPMVALRHE